MVKRYICARCSNLPCNIVEAYLSVVYAINNTIRSLYFTAESIRSMNRTSPRFYENAVARDHKCTLLYVRASLRGVTVATKCGRRARDYPFRGAVNVRRNARTKSNRRWTATSVRDVSGIADLLRERLIISSAERAKERARKPIKHGSGVRDGSVSRGKSG